MRIIFSKERFKAHLIPTCIAKCNYSSSFSRFECINLAMLANYLGLRTKGEINFSAKEQGTQSRLRQKLPMFSILPLNPRAHPHPNLLPKPNPCSCLSMQNSNKRIVNTEIESKSWVLVAVCRSCELTKILLP